MTLKSLPTQGVAPERLYAAMEEIKRKDIRWGEGRAFSLVFKGDPEMDEVIRRACMMFFSENGLNPSAFPSLKQFENEVVAMMVELLQGADQGCGSMTSGGTESILMAVKAAREWGKKNKPGHARYKMVVPLSVHPAFDKAAHYFEMDIVKAPLNSDYRVDVAAVEKLIDERTVLLVGSAPQYPQGVIDPITALGELAQKHNTLLHVDGCVGGVLLPFFKKHGAAIADFDFSVAGVTSISADLHKYGYAAKGASVVLFKNKQLRRHSYFASTDWPGGMYASPSVLGTRAGGPIAAAWAIMNYLGVEGYMRVAGTIKETVEAFKQGIEKQVGVKLAVNPDMSVMCLVGDGVDIYQVGDGMTKRGWHMDRQQNPAGLHLTVTYAHSQVIDAFFKDLTESVNEAGAFGAKLSGMKTGFAKGLIKAMPKSVVGKLVEREGKSFSKELESDAPKSTAAMYGMMEALPGKGDLDGLVLDVLDGLFTLQKPLNLEGKQQ
jgi:sphinganine-1-phosphate aldolase